MSQVKSLLRVPYGLRDGKMWAARDVPTGLACGCLCVGCEHPLVAKNQGIKIRPHFAHHVDRACQGAFESSIHRRAKELIVEKGVLMLPGWNGTEAMPNPPSAQDEDGCVHEGERVELPANMAELSDGRSEVQRGDYRPDAVAWDAVGELLIEIRVTHAVGDLKIRKVQSDGHRMVEIDLSKITADQAEDPDLFEQLVLNTVNNRIWISHPQAAESWRRSRDELRDRIRNANSVIAANRAHRQRLREQRETQAQEKAANKERFRQKCRQGHQTALAELNQRTSPNFIKEKCQSLLERDELIAQGTINRVSEPAARFYLRIVPDRSWVYERHPCLWQAGAYLHFIEGKNKGDSFEQSTLGRWIRTTYGVDELLWSLFRAQCGARSEALNRGYHMHRPWAWFFSREENLRIPNFFVSVDAFVENMVRCGVLQRDRIRRGWLVICESPTSGQPPVQPSALQQSAQFLPALPLTLVKVAPIFSAPTPSTKTSDPFLGRSLWHEGLGTGLVIRRAVHCSPIYDVRFRHENSRRILLRSDQPDWEIGDSLL